jgi:hypothetical protein
MKKFVTLLTVFAGLAAASTEALAQQPGRPPDEAPAAKSLLAPLSAVELETLALGLVDTTMHTFIEGVRQKDMRVLGPITSLKFRKSYTPEQVNTAFQQFFATTIVGDPLAGKSPIFVKAPEITKAGLLAIEGFYELPDGLLLFQLALVREGMGWKLDGIAVKSQPYNAPSAKPAQADKPLKFKIPAGKMVDA